MREKGVIAFFSSLSCAFYCCGYIQLESLKLFPVEKYNHFLRDTQTHILRIHTCECYTKRGGRLWAPSHKRLSVLVRRWKIRELTCQNSGSKTDIWNSKKQISNERLDSSLPYLFSQSTAYTVTTKRLTCSEKLETRKREESWHLGAEQKADLERSCDGKPARLPRTHRQGRGGEAASPGRPGWVLPSPQQWLCAGLLLPVCAVSINTACVIALFVLPLSAIPEASVITSKHNPVFYCCWDYWSSTFTKIKAPWDKQTDLSIEWNQKTGWPILRENWRVPREK